MIIRYPNRGIVTDRLRRLRHLRALGAPRWIVRDEQVRLASYRKHPLQINSEYQDELWLKYVQPLIGA